MVGLLNRANQLACFRRHLPEAIALEHLSRVFWHTDSLVHHVRAEEDAYLVDENDNAGRPHLHVRRRVQVIDIAPYLKRRTAAR